MSVTPDGAEQYVIFERVFGRRVHEFTEFAQLVDGESVLATDTVRELFDMCAGRLGIARMVISGAQLAGVDVSIIDPQRYSALIAPQDLPADDLQPESDPLLRLLELLAWLPTITPVTIRIARSALSTGQRGAPAADIGGLLSQLVLAGLLRLQGDRPGHYEMPELVRVIICRTTLPWAGSVRCPRAALGTAVENTYRSLQAAGDIGIEEILTMAGEIEDWGLLETIWAEHRANLFLGDLRAVTDAYLTIPEDVASDRPVLALARHASVQVDTICRSLGTDDPVAVIPAAPLETLLVPSLDVGLDGLDFSHLRADELIVLTIQSARALRLQGLPARALEVIERGRTRVGDTSTAAHAASPLQLAELDRENAAALSRNGRYVEALSALNRAIGIAEANSPGSLFPLLGALAASAQVHLLIGHGTEADRALRRAADLETSLGFTTAVAGYATHSTTVFRSLDRLDGAAAQQALASARTSRTGFGSESVILMGEGLHAVYAGRAGLAARILEERRDGRPSWFDDVGTMNDSSILNTLSFVYLAAGETAKVQHLLEQALPATPGYGLAKARLHLALGQIDEMEALIPSLLNGFPGPRLKGCAHALRAAGLQLRGRSDEALAEFGVVLDYAVIASTVLGIAQLPASLRTVFVESSADSTAWQMLAQTFLDSPVTADDLRRRILELPETMRTVDRPTHVLNAGEMSLLFALNGRKSIAAIAKERGLVEGTVKNRLSALYRKLGVRNRAGAISVGEREGYFSTSRASPDVPCA